MNTVLALSSSAIVSALVGSLATLVIQHRLARRAVELDYELHARKRLYEAIGPLRFQLLLAVRDLLRRLKSHPTHSWSMDPSTYYAHSFIYRLLRPLAIVQLIERQMGTADFSVDASALDVIRFKTAVVAMLSGNEILLGHPGEDWHSQSQHLYSQNVEVAAGRLVVEQDGQPPRVMTYGEFSEAFEDPRSDRALAPLAEFFVGCTAHLWEKPVLWLRLVGYGYAGARILERHGSSLGVASGGYPIERLLGKLEDDMIAGRIPDYAAAIRATAEDPA